MSSSDAPRSQNPSDLPPRPGEAPEIGTKPNQPSTSDENSSIGTEIRSPNNHNEHPTQRTARALSPLFDEIRLLQERLLYLEDQAVQEWKATGAELPSEHSISGVEAESSGSIDDERLRKDIRKAPAGRQWVETTEQQAEEEVDERKDYGQGPNKTYTTLSKSTMYHVRPSGGLMPGFQGDALFKPKGWVDSHGQELPGFSYYDEAELRRRERPFPNRGVRPPTAIHPFYEKPVRSVARFEVHPPRLSRKLGPPTKWDDYDSEEWSSDTSTRSQDFKYFRSRLRGDFEWELDRLNAQVLRYRKHKDKTKSRQLATKARKDNERRDEELGEHHQQSELMEEFKLDVKAAVQDEHGIRQLNPVEWSVFRLRRTLPLRYSYVIDVLIEEPKLSRNIEAWGRVRREKTDKKTHQADPNSRTKAAEETDKEGDTIQISKQTGHWTEQEPLPERIRVNSKQIIDALSDMHGSPLCLDADEASSVALLRPFRLLISYEKEIRQICSALEDNAVVEAEKSIYEGEESEKQTIKSTVPPAQNPCQTSPVPGDKTKASEGNEKPTDEEERFIKRMHLTCLRQFMDEYIGRKVAYLNSASCSKVFFSDVWYLFQPGTTVISAEGKQAYRVINLRSKRHKGADRWAAFWNRRSRKDMGKQNIASDSSDDSTDDRRADLTVTCVFIHFDGQSFGPVIQTFQINKWDGEKEITYLDIYPIRFHVLKHLDKRSLSSTAKIPTSGRDQEIEEGVQALRQKLIDRGRVFLDVAAVKQMYYSGLTVDTRDEIDGQVMVDFEEALSHESRRNWVPKITRVVGTSWGIDTDDADEGCTAECCWQENVHDDAYVETNNTEKFIDDMMAEIKDTPQKLPSAIIFPRTLEETKTEANALTDEELMIMSYSVFGFVLRDRVWAKLDLDCISAVGSIGNTADKTDDELEEGGKSAFGQLVLPSGHKKMVLSLISQHFRNKGSQESSDKQVDIVRGKGKGLIILLHGAPGVGKTTTAEGVAETFGQPLFQITCGDLGSNAKDVETALQTNFALANRWGCILLLDEADVFLAERRREDFNRNGLVAVFLRVLEYYAGILFLTTNRIGDFDEAFASRIHMSLHYPALDEVSTAKVFRLNLGLIKSRLQDRVKIEEDEIITAAGKHWREHKHARWNGRQIRNACQTALALAEFDAQPKGKKYDIKEKSSAKVHLKLSHLEIVSNAYLEFTDYLKAVHGADAEGRAKESGLRALDTLLDALKPDSSGRRPRDRRSSSSERGQTGHETPFQGFRLRPLSSGQRPAPRMPSPSSPEPASQHAAGHQGLYSPQRLAQEPPSGPAQRMQYNQSAYTGHQQFIGDQPSGLHPMTQHVQPGSYLQAPQGYTSGGRGGHGHYQPSDPYVHDNQQLRGHGVSYPSPPPSAIRGGPMSGSASSGHFGDDQGRQVNQSGQGQFDESEQM